MAQRKQLSWSELRVGLFVLAGLSLLVVAVFYVTSSENPLAPKYQLVTYLPEVAGLTVGAPVRLDGIDVGNVNDVRVNESSANTPQDVQRNIILTMRINENYMKYIRSDSIASPETEGLLGNRYVNIRRGRTGAVLTNGQEIQGKPEQGINQLVAQGTVLEEHMNGLIDNVQGMVTDVRGGKGTLGQVFTNRSMYDHLEASADKLDTMLTNIEAGQGSFGEFYKTDTTYRKVDLALDRFNNALEAIQQQKGTLGKLVYDTSFHDSARQFLNKGNSLIDDIRGGNGTITKLLKDDSLFTVWKQAGTNLSEATAKLNQDTSTAGRLFSDPKLYDNLTGLAGDLRLFMNDFRKNPKEYLHVKFTLF